LKILGIDYGRKRWGIAICGALNIASPAGLIVHKTWQEDMAALQEFLEDVETIVVGLPKNMDDSCGEMAQEASQFAKKLSDHLHLPVVLWDERLTTWQAEQSLLAAGFSRARRQKSRDQVAAAVMLQSYVDAQART
jgi:putative Holliday junction resolvase